jgi:3-phytase
MALCAAHGFAPICPLAPWAGAFVPSQYNLNTSLSAMAIYRPLTAAALLASSLSIQAAAVDVEIPVSAVTSEVESDWSAVYYGKTPLLLGNDGSAATGGWLAWNLNSAPSLTQTHAETPGRRTKLVTTIHGREDDDDDEKPTGLAVSIGQPDSILCGWELPDFEEVESARTKVLGDWSALCSWKSPSGNDYVYLLGKKEAKVFLVRKDHDEDDYEDSSFVEVRMAFDNVHGIWKRGFELTHD